MTLTGVGGSGKTRLAIEVAKDLVEAYPDGAWLVELASLSQGELVPQAVARALKAREQPYRPLLETLEDTLREEEDASSNGQLRASHGGGGPPG